MAESTPLENPELGKASKSFRSFKMKKIKNLMVKTMQHLIKKYNDLNAVLKHLLRPQ
ncbi:hypothetical protein FHS59_003546 [Algoriphagus iocasae]|jgi:hypothetical protein|uniref:Uncharacterized protein n=1 Tax=Algoriphagus iocasae TaxID=1836499 RepID=A0A841MLZ0_9BACT|nr:hypothetical protein [Algoriphagus iocasae]